MSSRVEGINANLSRRINEGGGVSLSGKDLRLNDQTIVQHAGKYYILRRDEPDGEWLKLSLMVVDVNTLEVVNGDVALLKYTVENIGQAQTFTTSLIKHGNCRDAKLELSCNPTDPRTWYLVIHGNSERRVYIHQQTTSSRPTSFKFYEYRLNYPGFRTVKWTPYSRKHIFVLYKNKLEVVNYAANLILPELSVDLLKLYIPGEDTQNQTLEYVDLGFHQGPSDDLSAFSVFLITKQREIHALSPVVLTNFDIPEETFKNMVDKSKSKNNELGQNALPFLYTLGFHEESRLSLDPTVGKLNFSVNAQRFYEFITLNVLPINNREQATGDWCQMHMVAGSNLPMILISDRFGNEGFSKMHLYVYPDLIGMEYNLQTAFQGLYEFEMPINERIVSIKTAKDVKWNYPRVLADRDGTVTVLSYNRLFTLHLQKLLQINKNNLKENASVTPQMTLLFENEVHQNKQPDEFDSGYYSVDVDPQRIATVRLYDADTPVFQLSPIVQVDGSKKLKDDIRRYLEGALNEVIKTLPSVRPKTNNPATIDIRDIKKISEPELLLQRLNTIIEQSERSVIRQKIDSQENLKNLESLKKEIELNDAKKRSFQQRIARIEETNKKIQELKRIRSRKNIESGLKKAIDEIQQDHQNIQSIVKKLDNGVDINKKPSGLQLNIDSLLEDLQELRSRLKKLQHA